MSIVISKKMQSYNKPTVEEAEAAVEVLIRWAGDDPSREGLKDTPKRVAESYKECFAGYHIDPLATEVKTFTEIAGYDEMVLLKGINFYSYCEHHVLPMIGQVTIAYIPNKKVIGISKLARIVDIFAKRLQIQEKLTAQIGDTLDQLLKPQGVAVIIQAEHHCMSARGVNKKGSLMHTSHMIGSFKLNLDLRQELFSRLALKS